MSSRECPVDSLPEARTTKRQFAARHRAAVVATVLATSGVACAVLGARWMWRTSPEEEPPCLGYDCGDNSKTHANLAFSQDSVNQLIPGIVDNLFPALTAYVNKYAGKELTKDAKEGSCCDWGDTGVDAEAHIAGFYLHNPGADQVSLIVSAIDEHSFNLNVRANNLAAGFNNVGASVGFAVLIPISCSIEVTTSVSIPQMSVDLKVFLNGDGRTVTISPGSVSFPGASLSIGPSAGWNICAPVSLLAGLLASAFTSLGTDLWNDFYPLLDSTVSDAIVGVIGKVSFSIPEVPPIDVSSAGVLRVWPDIRSLMASTSGPGIAAEGLVHVRATKSDGSEFEATVPPSMASQEVPMPSVNHLVSVNLGASITQKLVSAIWWMLVDPFHKQLPPLISAAVKLLFWELHNPARQNAAMPPRPKRRVYYINVTFPAPSIVFGEEDLSAVVPLEAVIYAGTTNLILVNSTLSFPMDLPTYNPSNGTFGGLALHNASISELTITTPTKPDHGEKWEKQLRSLLLPFFDGLANDILLPMVNEALASTLRKIPLQIPPIAKFPIDTVDTHIDITQLIFGASASSGANVMGCASGAGEVKVSFTKRPGAGARNFLPGTKPGSHVEAEDFYQRTLAMARRMKNRSNSVSVSYVGPAGNSTQVLA